VVLVSGSAAAATSGSPAAHARAAAKRILSERRFQEPKTPHPLQPLAHAIGRALDPVVRFIANLIPAGDSWLWYVIAALVLGLAVFYALRLVHRRSLVAEGGGDSDLPGRGARRDPARLERDADSAEARGELELALRLRFKAGLLRLQMAKVVPARDSLTSGDVRRRLKLVEFDRVAVLFDEVVYGRRVATGADVAELRDGWQKVLVRTKAG
jgi:hypothetical protein